jgi:hypothetical protein
LASAPMHSSQLFRQTLCEEEELEELEDEAAGA